MTLHVKWIDRGLSPKCEPNPAYPRGIDIDVSNGEAVCCIATLPYPAKRVGLYVITCDKCKTTTVVTTAGRPDDPRSVKLGCAVQPGQS
jgi:hypothetical protein